MSLLDNVLEHEEQAPTSLDWSKIKDGYKWKTVLYAEKEAYEQRVGITTPIDEDIYLFQCLVDYFKIFKKNQEMISAQRAMQEQFKAAQLAIDEGVAAIDMELT